MRLGQWNSQWPNQNWPLNPLPGDWWWEWNYFHDGEIESNQDDSRTENCSQIEIMYQLI